MPSLKELLRLVLTTSLSDRQIGRVVSLSYNTVARYRRLARSLTVTWESLAHASYDDLDRLFNQHSVAWCRSSTLIGPGSTSRCSIAA